MAAAAAATDGVLGNIAGGRVLVTGGYGAIGAMVVRRLLEVGALPVVLDVLDGNPYLHDVAGDFVGVHQDIRDLDGVVGAVQRERVDHVIHLAKAIGPKTQEDPRLALTINVLGSGNVLEAAKVAGVPRVVFSSSKSVYAELSGEHAPPTQAPITEDYPTFERGDPKDVLFYSTTNKMVEYYGIRFARRFGMEFVVTRFASTYGPGKPRRRVPNPGGGFGGRAGGQERREVPYKTFGNLACYIVESAFDGASLDLPEGGDQRADLVYNGDLANGLIAAACSDRIRFSGGWREFNLGLGRAVTGGEVAEAATARFPEAEVRIGPGGMSSYDHAEILAVFDLTRARQELGYEPAYPPPAAVEHYAQLLELGRRAEPAA